MARYNGKGTVAMTYNIKSYAPLDVRMIVEFVSDLVLDSTWTIDGALRTYNGMLTVVANDTPENCGLYYLQDAAAPGKNDEPNHTSIANWHKLCTLAELEAIIARLTIVEENTADFVDKIADLETTVNGIPASEGVEPVAGLVDKVATNTQAISEETEARLLAVTELEDMIEATLQKAKTYADEHDADTIYDDTEVRGLINGVSTQVAELVGNIDTINASLANKADIANVVANTTFEEFKTENTAAIIEAKQEAINAAAKAEEAKGYAVASEVAETYATKATTLAGYGITDAYTKDEVAELIEEAGGGDSSAVEAVKKSLADYIQNTDTELYGAELVESWTAADGTYAPAYADATSRIDTAIESLEDVSNAVDGLETGLTTLTARVDNITQPKASDEITVADDGTLGIAQVNVDKLVQSTGDVLTIDGGTDI